MLIVAALVFNSSVQFLLNAMSSLYPAVDFNLLSIFNMTVKIREIVFCIIVMND